MTFGVLEKKRNAFEISLKPKKKQILTKDSGFCNF